MIHSHGKCQACIKRRVEIGSLKLASARAPKSALELAAVAAWDVWSGLDAAVKQHIRRTVTLSPAFRRACKRLAVLLEGDRRFP